MEFVVGPLFHEWQIFNPTNLSQTLVTNIQTNKKYWQDISAETEAEYDGTKSPINEATRSRQESMSDAKSSNASLNIVFTEIDTGDMSDEDQIGLLAMPAEIQSLLGARRHSMPPSLFLPKKDHYRLMVRRESYPRAKYMRRGSLPKSLYHSTSLSDHISQPTNGNRSVSLEAIISRPNISVLSAFMDTESIVYSQSEESQSVISKPALQPEPDRTEHHVTHPDNLSKGYTLVPSVTLQQVDGTLSTQLPPLVSTMQTDNESMPVATSEDTCTVLLPVTGW